MGEPLLRSRIFKHLRSICCNSLLEVQSENASCSSCGTAVEFSNGSIWLREGEAGDIESDYFSGIRTIIRRRKWLYNMAMIISPVLRLGLKSTTFLANNSNSDSIALDIGSANNRINPLVTNIDILPYNQVDIVADACKLPINDQCVDSIVSETSLEHIPDSNAALEEFSRVLKQGGKIFIEVPFMQPLHAAPMDYKRWTVMGLTNDLSRVGINVTDSGIASGPASGFSWMLAEFIATILSLGSTRIRKLISLPIQALCSPIKWLDLVLYWLPTSEVMASSIWVIGVKE